MDTQQLKIIHYPNPVLRKQAATINGVDDDVRALVERMFELMREHKGVGLAAPQVNIPARLFVCNHTGEPEDDQVYINPVISEPDGFEDGDEGCLSIPGITVQIRRAKQCKITAMTLEGKTVELVASDLEARVWQHETDHLEGKLILDRMSPADKIATRKTLRALEEAYHG